MREKYVMGTILVIAVLGAIGAAAVIYDADVVSDIEGTDDPVVSGESALGSSVLDSTPDNVKYIVASIAILAGLCIIGREYGS